MAFTGTQLVTRARYQSNDTAGDYWDDTESLLWVNDAQRAIVAAQHKAGATTAQATIVNGSSRQTMSGMSLTRGIAFIDVVCNVAGSTRGAPIHRMSRAELDNELPGWHTATGTAIEGWIYNADDPLALYLYPTIASGTNKIEVIYAAPPADLASLAGSFGLDDIYAEAAVLYVLMRYFGKDLTKLKSAQFHAQYRQWFYESLGVRDRSVAATDQASIAKEQGA